MMNFESEEAASAWMSETVDDACQDNYRFAYADDPKAVAEYNEIQSYGCCGEFDADITINGREAMIGCNYGH